MGRLTTQEYWEKYYKDSPPDKNKIDSIVSVYDKYWDILINKNNAKPPKTILEIGGYPGRYLAYLGEKYNLVPSSLDFNSNKTNIDMLMQVYGIKEYEVIQEDIFTHKPQKQYDIVFSNGFIEHFNNFDIVLDKHIPYVKDGGTLLIMIPNKRWFRKWYGYLVDYQNLKAHNLKCMKKNVFVNFGKRNNLELLELEYFGGFPFSVHQNLNFFQKLIFKIYRILFKFFLNKYISKNPNKYFSSTLVAIYKK